MSAAPEPLMTFEQYLEFDRGSEQKHEYHDGHMAPVASMTEAHNLITLNLGRSLQSRLEASGCIGFTAGMRVWARSKRCGLFPDFSMVCGDRQYHDSEKDTLLNPAVLIEVLSKPREDYDHGAKFKFYRSIPAFKEYVLISQYERAFERYLKRSDTFWAYELFPESVGALQLATVPGELRFEDVYRGVSIQGA